MESQIAHSPRKERSLKKHAKQGQTEAKCLKRNLTPSQDAKEFQTTRKVRVITNQADNDKTRLPQSNKQGFQISYPLPIQQEVKSNEPSKKQKQISDIPLKQKFINMLPAYLTAQYTLQQTALLNIQQYLDSYLSFLKVNRGKKKGAFFKQIRSNLIQGNNIFVELSHIKQILFLLPTFYTYERGLDADHCYDILLDLPANAELVIRKDEFKRTLYEHITSRDKDEKNRAIPMFVFPFEQKIETQKKLTTENRENLKLLKANLMKTKTNQMDGFFANSKDFKEKLVKKLKQNEQKLEQQKLKAISIVFDRRDLLTLIDSIQNIYMCSELSNLPYSLLLKKLDADLKIPSSTLFKLFQKIIEMLPNYLTIADTRIGKVAQCHKKNYRNARDQIQLLMK